MSVASSGNDEHSPPQSKASPHRQLSATSATSSEFFARRDFAVDEMNRRQTNGAVALGETQAFFETPSNGKRSAAAWFGGAGVGT
jgi:hypothetical protein